MESDSPIRESRWHRPNRYLIIVSIYLICLAVFSVFSAIVESYVIEPYGDFFLNNLYWSQGWWNPFVASFSLIGFISFLMRRTRLGRFFSITIISLWQIPMADYYIAGIRNYFANVIIGLFLVSSVVMLTLLFVELLSKMEATEHKDSSMWKKPNLYLTLVIMYLLYAGSVAIPIGSAYIYENDTRENHGLSMLALPAYWFFSLFLIVPSLSAVSSLLHKKKVGAYYSLIALGLYSIVWWVSSYFIIFYALGCLVKSNLHGFCSDYFLSQSMHSIPEFIALIATGIMFFLIAKALKKVRWKEDSSLVEN